MRKADFWKSDWLLGLVVSLAVLAAGSGSLLQSLERKAYDLGMGMASRTPSDRIAVIAIDKTSIDNIGRWPWSRDVHAEMIDRLAGAGAKVVATTIFFSEPQVDPGLVFINKLIGQYGEAGGLPLSSADQDLSAQEGLLGPMSLTLKEAEAALSTDRRLAEAVGHAGNVVLPVLFHRGQPLGHPEGAAPDYLARNAIAATGDEYRLLAADGLVASVLPALGAGVAALGDLNILPDVDGAIRTVPLAMDYYGQAYPALALQIVRQALNLKAADLQVDRGDRVRAGRLSVTTDAASQMYPFYYADRDGRAPFPVDSFYDVRSGKIPLDKYRDKIVLIGPTDPGTAKMHTTPVSVQTPDVLMLAHWVSSILSEHYFVVPAWGTLAERLVLLAVALYLIFILPRLRAATGAALTALLLATLVGSHFFLMVEKSLWLQLMVPATLLLLGHLLLTTKHFLVTEKGKEKSELDSAESNRMLALAFQGQGQLDMAFDKFRKCPMDRQLMENLYNLALDFERRRQFNKAESVFRHMADYDPKFRDLSQRLTRARQMSETVMLQGNMTPTGTLILGGQVEKPMLGRYQVEKELGKGAMGVVYQGRDPKINRVVAIKTMALAQEFEGDELADVKQRFFREAETAGRLTHQNIVTIYDAGEEHDLAYIAMEFLKGRDLVSHTKPQSLLPLAKVLDILARVADALDYAHQNQVVHRDIKPANIMYEPQSDQVKVTDFGIARITDSSRTKTGMVLGTPSYMSPEQLAGKKIDGRSDLFSLGVTLYQLASGRLPFDGESLAQLMFRIANEPYPDIRQARSGLPDCLAAIVDRALVKDADRRYQTGAEMARDLRTCLTATAADGSARS